MDLLIDSGNSRLKWAYCQDGRLSGYGAAARDGGVPAEAQTAWRAGPRPTRIIVANVAGREFAQQLDRWVRWQWQLAAEYIRVIPHEGGIQLVYSEPERIGVDRWLALLAARRCAEGTVAVIDAGTALTLDVVSREGRHQGGIIIPGIQLMAEALWRKSAGIQAGIQNAKIAVDDGVLGADTRSCIEKGALYAVVGAIEHTLARLSVTMGTRLSVIICGGNAVQVMAELQVECQHVPDLVLRGMQIIKGGNQ